MTNEFSAGFSAFLKLMLLFLIIFVWMGYPVPVSIFFALFGGFSGGFICAWLNSSNLPNDSDILDFTTEEILLPKPAKKSSKYAKPQKSSSWWFFGGNSEKKTKSKKK